MIAIGYFTIVVCSRAWPDFGRGRRGVSVGGRGTRHGGLGQRLTAGKRGGSIDSKPVHTLYLFAVALAKMSAIEIEFHVVVYWLVALVVGKQLGAL